MRDGWPRRHPHRAMAVASIAFALALAALLLVAGRPPAAAAPALAAAPLAFVWCELFTLALGKPLVVAILDRPRGRGRSVPAPDDGSGLDGPEWGGELVDVGGYGFGDGGGGGGD
jgi:hypothetical protein